MGNSVSGVAKEGVFVSGSDCEVRDNRCQDNSASKPGGYDGIRITGARNCVTGNIVSSKTGPDSHRRPISDEGKDNRVETVSKGGSPP